MMGSYGARMGIEGTHTFAGIKNSHTQYICLHGLIMPVTILHVQLHVSMAMSSRLGIAGCDQSQQNPAYQNNFMNVSL